MTTQSGDPKCVTDQLSILVELQDEIWYAAFEQARNCRLLKDDVRSVRNDMDVVAMYCGNIFQ
jgi:hypothetical protein